MRQYISVRWKILLPMAAILFLIITALNLYSSYQQKERLLDLTEHQLLDIANGYMDSMNALMFTGAMASREILRDKISQREGIASVRMLRGEAVSNIYGPGFDHEKAQDDLDRRALSGETIIDVTKVDGERHITLILPFEASQNRHGTNCLTCHPVAEGTVLGAARITYSMAQRDQDIESAIIKNSTINFVAILAGLLIIYLIMLKVLIQPLNRLKDTMAVIGENADLRPRIQLGSNDEFRMVGEATNNMLDRFQPTIHNLTQTMDNLSQSADQLAEVTRETSEGVDKQKNESVLLAQSIQELSNAAEEVARNAANAEVSASGTKELADDGKNMVLHVAQTNAELAQKVDAATGVVKKLAEDAQGIGRVSQEISDIAEQTNLLALNAAIEAARAGEQGRGFAVVADEVRSLASRTQLSTEEIRTIIENLSQISSEAVQAMEISKAQADDSVEDANKAAHALEDIASSVDQIREMNTMIAAAASEQSAVVNEINNNIHAISAISEQTGAGSHKILRQSEDIASISQSLDKTINQFKS
ncbi:MAG: methyl-accepting chemotaxis protein [Marinomonas sp.]|uniref:Methyl-accepting chemotaxis protein n=1 Tax=Marinomonas communis TaxID=28254 RepID=A0A4R6XCN2_9GAMM|nr:HAMP domain-containing methyl-accepting chemotaxis protein [Marinomonas communis]MCC4272781.1 HAMP domain-containing methyl-accepting chemotaxis protein [Marinomonas communis]RUM55818.1 MAG: methyl-accepting chemotaxis protein [Marinomonas sp.]TDR15899.1 methyl-accepting chemotaxis protein [Marinomonas communis]